MTLGLPLEFINGRLRVRLPNGQFATLPIDTLESTPGLSNGAATSGGNRVDLPLTGGSIGCVVVLTSPTTCMDAHPFMKAALRAEPPLFKAAEGVYYRFTGYVPMPLTQADVDARGFVAVCPMQNGRNWRVYTGDIPADLDPATDPKTSYVHLGRVASTTLLRADYRQAESDNSAEIPVASYYETFSSLADGATPPITLLNELWNNANRTLLYDGAAKLLRQTITVDPRRAMAYVPAGQFVGGTVRNVSLMQINRATKKLRAIIGASGLGAASNTTGGTGAVGATGSSEKGWVAQLDETGLLGLYTYNNGAVSAAQTFQALPTVSIATNVPYAVEINRSEDGLIVKARAYIAGTAVPAWQLTNNAGTIPGAGWAAVANNGASDTGKTSYRSIDVSVGPAELAAAI